MADADARPLILLADDEDAITANLAPVHLQLRQPDGHDHMYNYHRAHTAIGGLPPISRVNNLGGNYS